MSTSNGSPEPTERTALLNDNGNDDLKISTSPSVNHSGSSSDADEEVGSVENVEEHPLFGGNAEMRKRMVWLFPAVSIGVLLSAADQTLVVTTYGKIGSDLNALNNTSWIATAYFLTLTSFQPLYGKLSDIFGRKPALLFAYTVFGLGCVGCGLARNLEELIAARAFAGIGGGGMTTVVSILMSDIIPLRQRGSWQGYMNLVYATGASAGAPLGGLLADSIGWRWAFLGQGPLCLLAIIIVYFILDLPHPNTSHWRSKILQIDFLGALSLIVAVSTLLIGLDRGSNVAWVDKLAVACCATSIPLFGIFVFVEMKIASHPFAPGHIIFTRSLFASYMSNFFNMAAYMATMFYVPLYLQVVDHLSATGAGLRLIPPMVLSVSGSLFGGHVMQRTGKYYWLTMGCFGCSIVGSVTVFLSSRLVDQTWVLVAGLSVMAFGGGAIITTTLISVIANAAAEDQAVATACTYLFRSLGSVVGVSLGSTVVQQVLRTGLRETLDGDRAEWIVEGVRRSLDFIKSLDGETRAVVAGCYKNAVGGAFGLTIGCVLLAFFSASWMKEVKLSK